METRHLDIGRLKKCREAVGISKLEAAKRIGVSQPAYLRYESGERTPSIQVIKEMADVFHTSVDYLLGKTSSSEVTSYTVNAADSPELFALVEKYYRTDKEQLKKLMTYLEHYEKARNDGNKKGRPSVNYRGASMYNTLCHILSSFIHHGIAYPILGTSGAKYPFIQLGLQTHICTCVFS